VKVGDKDVPISKEYVSFVKDQKIIQEEKYVPSVIEPSFGIGRIIYCVFEHCFKIRPKPKGAKATDPDRTYFDFPALISPIKCSLLPLMS